MNEASTQGGGSPAEAPAPTPFQILCGSLAAQVHMALGLIPDPVSKKAVVELPVARQGIDLLVMLEEKTEGNLDDEEKKTLTGLTAQLRMIYIEVAKQLEKQQEQTSEAADEAEAPAGEAAPDAPDPATGDETSENV